MGMVQEAREEREEGERVGEDMVMEVVGRVGKAMDKEEEEREVVERVGEEEADSKVAVRSTWPQLWQLPRPLQLLSHRPTATAESEVFNASSYTD
jgi:hypothetical protein